MKTRTEPNPYASIPDATQLYIDATEPGDRVSYQAPAGFTLYATHYRIDEHEPRRTWTSADLHIREIQPDNPDEQTIAEARTISTADGSITYLHIQPPRPRPGALRDDLYLHMSPATAAAIVAAILEQDPTAAPAVDDHELQTLRMSVSGLRADLHGMTTQAGEMRAAADLLRAELERARQERDAARELAADRGRILWDVDAALRSGRDLVPVVRFVNLQTDAGPRLELPER